MGTAINHAAAIKRLEALFDDVKLVDKKIPQPPANIETRVDTKCDVHGKNGTRRGSLGNVLHVPGPNLIIAGRRDLTGTNGKPYQGIFNNNNGVGPRRESMPALNFSNNSYYRRRDTLGIPHSPAKREIEHPSNFPAMLRKDTGMGSTGSLRKDGTLAGPWLAGRRDSIGSTYSLKRDYLQPNGNRCVIANKNGRRFSTDSLDGRRNSWDPGRRGSSGSSMIGWDDSVHDKVT